MTFENRRLEKTKKGRAAHLEPENLLLFSQQLRHGLQRFNMLGYDLDDDNDRNAEQHPPDAPEPTPEQQ